ncbi:MAG: fibronectin type III domain-containing protein [Cellvibrionales bacterium]|jgi:hypothetical protein
MVDAKPEKRRSHLIDALIRTTLATFLSVSSTAALAGKWGESWGRMYWGDTPDPSTPAAPTIESVVADSDTITITMAPYPQGDGTDGWSAVYEYQVVCGNLDPVTFTDTVTIQNLDSDTEYSCAVTATNEVGNGDQTLQVVMTDAALQGLNIIMLCAAIDCGNS